MQAGNEWLNILPKPLKGRKKQPPAPQVSTINTSKLQLLPGNSGTMKLAATTPIHVRQDVSFPWILDSQGKVYVNSVRLSSVSTVSGYPVCQRLQRCHLLACCINVSSVKLCVPVTTTFCVFTLFNSLQWCQQKLKDLVWQDHTQYIFYDRLVFKGDNRNVARLWKLQCRLFLRDSVSEIFSIFSWW